MKLFEIFKLKKNLGQMVSDVLEIALKARSHALGPLHPSFNIVEILKNGLRRLVKT